MAKKKGVKVIADRENGRVVLSFGEAIESYSGTAEEMADLAEELFAAVDAVEGEEDVEDVEADAQSAEFADLDEEAEEPVGEIVMRLKREEKEAHGGD